MECSSDIDNLGLMQELSIEDALRVWEKIGDLGDSVCLPAFMADLNVVLKKLVADGRLDSDVLLMWVPSQSIDFLLGIRSKDKDIEIFLRKYYWLLDVFDGLGLDLRCLLDQDVVLEDRIVMDLYMETKEEVIGFMETLDGDISSFETVSCGLSGDGTVVFSGSGLLVKEEQSVLSPAEAKAIKILD